MSWTRWRYGLAALAVATLGFSAGGWATITVEDLPDALPAGEPVELAFTIRQHGQEPMSDRNPFLEVRQGRVHERIAARRAGAPGRYAAVVTLPRTGEWSLTIDGDFGPSRVTLLPIVATGPGTHTPPTLTPYDRGHRLFVAKGCVTCHVHAAVEDSGPAGVGPDLTVPRYDAKYLARLLDDPSILPVRGSFRMPDLGLAPPETEALVSFLTGR